MLRAGVSEVSPTTQDSHVVRRQHVLMTFFLVSRTSVSGVEQRLKQQDRQFAPICSTTIRKRLRSAGFLQDDRIIELCSIIGKHRLAGVSFVRVQFMVYGSPFVM